MTEKQHGKIWHKPWGYKEAFIIGIGLFGTGLALDFSTGIAFPKPSYPWNLSAALFLVSVLLIMHLLRKESSIIKWLSSVPVAIASISLFTFISVLMGLIPQKNIDTPSFSNLLDSWAYFFSYLFLLIALGLAALKRTIPLKRKNISYLLNHWGLWIALAAAGFGVGDIQKYNMYLTEGQTTWYAYNNKQETIELPFALTLEDFLLENYPAKIAIVDVKTNKILEQNGKPAIVDLPIDKNITMLGHDIKTTEYMQLALPDSSSNYKPSIDTGAVQAAFITVNNAKGWVSPGNFFNPMTILPIDDTIAIAMLTPEPRRYASYLKVITAKKERFDAVIEVNNPIEIAGWKLYQSDYDSRLGYWSRHSILEIVKDPWLPIVFVGLYIMILGAFLIIFQGKTKKRK